MFFYVGLLRAYDDISLGHMSAVLFFGRIAILWSFAFATIRIGLSPIIAAIALYAATHPRVRTGASHGCGS
jgi:hypothetical protein